MVVRPYSCVKVQRAWRFVSVTPLGSEQAQGEVGLTVLPWLCERLVPASRPRLEHRPSICPEDPDSLFISEKSEVLSLLVRKVRPRKVTTK